MDKTRHVSLTIQGQDQVLTIPPEFAITGTEVVLRKDGERLIIEPILPSSLLALLTTLSDLEEDFPDIDERTSLL
ncbi:AbrB/MazE/SpoVT family DNA-binding domain-containing protein [Nodosilinea sp. LEGE 07088]|uniref:AbrB/MazE/SpoVT family DNA-binding domain-containing protein n=1 Tax=Nodosilinea sp. LEGE 07088 TaxID=2777968 RepID=UPI00187F6D87|nr:AbrB/MazE/SpoVT family DNA-binding domain-containing protein [Nodosilinea sp. LEGE 07088]MBE9141362.1 AbrB/MazE/SpoVT family DNA-binding domain-containing protein [Nodosilinea sp. LEGE 07088]